MCLHWHIFVLVHRATSYSDVQVFHGYFSVTVKSKKNSLKVVSALSVNTFHWKIRIQIVKIVKSCVLWDWCVYRLKIVECVLKSNLNCYWFDDFKSVGERETNMVGQLLISRRKSSSKRKVAYATSLINEWGLSRLIKLTDWTLFRPITSYKFL